MSSRRHNTIGRKLFYALLCVWALLVACNGSGQEANSETVNAENPLNVRVNCTQGEMPTCELVVRILAADSDIEPDFEATMLPAMEFSSEDPQILVKNGNDSKGFAFDDVRLLHQEWREIRVNLTEYSELVHSGCYVIRVHATDDLPDKYQDETQIFIYAENGELQYYHTEQQFLDKLDIEFQYIPGSPIAYGVKISEEDPTRGELFVKLSNTAGDINASNIKVEIESGINFADLDDINLENSNRVSSNTGSTWRNGYRVVVIPFQLDPNEYPGRRTLRAYYDYQNVGSIEKLVWEERAPLGIAWEQMDNGERKLKFDPVEPMVMRNGIESSFFTGGQPPNLCINGFRWLPLENIPGGTPEEIYQRHVALLGIMTYQEFRSGAPSFNHILQMEQLTNGGNYTFKDGVTYMLPQCVTD